MASNEERIKSDVVRRITTNDTINARDIGVYVHAGHVTLQGSVPEERARTTAASEAMQVSGVITVDNHLRVSPAPPPKTGLDTAEETPAKDIERHVAAALAELHEVNIEDLRIQAVDDMISLKGCVDALWKKARVGDVVRSLKCVHDVENKLAVVPTCSRLDQDIALDIEAALERHPLTSAETITVTVEHGVVTLTANLANGSTKQNALKVAMDTPGVMEIKDAITVRQDIGENPLDMR